MPQGKAPAEDEIRAECQAIADILVEKNRNYGNSVLDPVRIFSRADAQEQIKVRIDDKLSRVARGYAGSEDVALDLIGYLVFLRIADRWQQPHGSNECFSGGACACRVLSPYESAAEVGAPEETCDETIDTGPSVCGRASGCGGV